MTEIEQTVMPANDAKPRRAGRTKTFCVIFVLFLMAAGVGGFYFCPEILKMHGGGTVVDLGPTQQRISELEQQVQAINNRVDGLSAHVNKAASKDMDETEEGHSSEELKRMQDDMTKLSALVTSLQSEVKQAGASAQRAAQSSMASAIAFIQLRSVAEAGRGFTSELANLRNVAPDDTRFRDNVDKLTPYAEKGAPVISVLRDEFINLESSVSVAIDKTAAQNWWQRIVAELKSLVSIRPLHGADATDVLTVTENALSAGKLETALATVKTLPVDAQNVLKDWVVKVQARAAIDAGLQDLSDRFVMLASPNSNQRNEP